jgi:hypothetical protein
VVARLSEAGIRHSNVGRAAIALLVIGWALALVGIVKRTLYHRRRMGG